MKNGLEKGKSELHAEQRKILKIILEGKKDEEVNRIIEYPGIGPGNPGCRLRRRG
jgi:hypothetical protein